MVAPALTLAEEREAIIEYEMGEPITAICKRYGIHRATFYRILERHRVTPNRYRDHLDEGGDR